MKGRIVFPLVLMAVFALSRWPGLMPDNFSAAYAIAFCAGLFFPGRLAWWLPMGALLASDIAINVLYYRVEPVSPMMLGNYAAFAALIWLGRRFSSSQSWLVLLGGGVLGAVLFYLITNTLSWMQLPYPKTFSGWIQALTSGLPGYPPTIVFFWKTLLSGGLFTGLFAGAMKAGEALAKAEEKAEESEEEPAAEEPEEAKA